MNKQAKIFVAGHRGLVGSGIVRRLKTKGYENLVLRTRDELDLLNQADVASFLKAEQPDYIFLAAAKVGGINANNIYRADFIYQNLMIEANVINGAYEAGVERLLFLGSNCIYPKEAPIPIKEDYLLTGPLEKTNEPYALAKIAGLKLCESYNIQHGTKYICAMPINLYGPNDHYDLANCHVLPALLRKAHEAKKNGDAEFTVWGSGTPRREFLYVDDMADACIFLMESGVPDGVFNVGVGEDITIRELAEVIMEVVEFEGELIFDSTKPDGTLRKLLDVTKLSDLGWKPSIDLKQGLQRTYKDYIDRFDS